MTLPANPPNPESPGSPAPSHPSDPAAQKPGVVDIEEVIRKTAETTRNSIFAELRRKDELPDKTKRPTTNASPDNPASAPNLRALDRAISGSGRVIDDRAYARMEAAFQAESPSDAKAWVAEYFSGFGATASAATTAPNGAPAAPQPNNAIPASNGGTPPPPNAPLEERNIIGMSESDVKELARRKGNSYVRKKLTDELRGKRVKFK